MEIQGKKPLIPTKLCLIHDCYTAAVLLLLGSKRDFMEQLVELFWLHPNLRWRKNCLFKTHIVVWKSFLCCFSQSSVGLGQANWRMALENDSIAQTEYVFSWWKNSKRNSRADIWHTLVIKHTSGSVTAVDLPAVPQLIKMNCSSYRT